MTTTSDFHALLADDAYAASFQSMGQYRTALLKALVTPPPKPPTDEELIRAAEESGFVYEDDGCLFNSYQEGADIKTEVLSFARAALERWGNG